MSEATGQVPEGYFVQKTLQTWHQAFENCYDPADYVESKMAIIQIAGNDTEIQDIIENLLSNLEEDHCYHIGVHDLFYEGHYLDIYGREIDYKEWHAGQPDNFGGNENCVAINNKLEMYDVACDSLCYYICMEPIE
ncbi:hypothetical protein L9F63_017826 [Diploptera punctata]|uniref:C-type lectin domain-containing protein n=1 Tax=Diploptera punctata TaxID=6984 RepID=A0AAD7ZYR6_DIPPU|nr:hypothetical protein L9F63_017826 [Diploptera punctata]